MNKTSDQSLAGFERRLLDELTEFDAQRPPAAQTAGAGRSAGMGAPAATGTRPWRMRPALIGGSLAALVAGVVYLGIPSATSPSVGVGGTVRVTDTPSGDVNVRPVAFTVRKNADGTVTFTVHDLVDTDAATKALNGAGITGRVLNAATQACPATADVRSPNSALLKGFVGKGTNTVTLTSSVYPRGGGVLLVVAPTVVDPTTGRALHIWVTVLVFVHSEEIPTCVA